MSLQQHLQMPTQKACCILFLVSLIFQCVSFIILDSSISYYLISFIVLISDSEKKDTKRANLFLLSAVLLFVCFIVTVMYKKPILTKIVIIGQMFILVPIINLTAVAAIFVFNSVVLQQEQELLYPGFVHSFYKLGLTFNAYNVARVTSLGLITIVVTVHYILALRKLATLQTLENSGNYNLLIDDGPKCIKCSSTQQDV